MASDTPTPEVTAGPLTPEHEARVRAAHPPDPDEPHSCFYEYPCPIPNLFAMIDALRAQVDAVTREKDQYERSWRAAKQLVDGGEQVLETVCIERDEANERAQSAYRRGSEMMRERIAHELDARAADELEQRWIPGTMTALKHTNRAAALTEATAAIRALPPLLDEPAPDGEPSPAGGEVS